MAIPESFLDDLMSRTDIVDLISSYVPLQKKGGRYWACCPFHSEKTPSFSVTPDKQMYYCFGCHKGGGAVSFVMEEEGVGFTDAVAILAKRAGIPMPEYNEDEGQRKRRERLLELNKAAARWFHANLSTPQAEPGRRYFARRGLSKRTITNFGLGYAFPEWDALLKAMQTKGYTKRELLDAGLAVSTDKGRIYDRFRGRVMFPIIDLRGNVIGFGGRVLDDTKPKYLNSPDTLIYNKSRNLFAMNIVKKSKAGQIILTEGYMDTIALHQAGFDCAVASLGTSLTEDHARLLAKYTKEIVLSYDSDEAGVAAAKRAIGILNRVGLNVKVLKVVGAKDPDEFLKQYGPSAFQRLLDQSENQAEYQLLQIQKKYDLTDDEQRVRFLQEAAQFVALMPSPVEREVYGSRAARAAGVESKVMSEEVERQRRQKSWRTRRQEERKALTPAANHQPDQRSFRYEHVRSALAEEGVIRLVLMDPSLFERLGSLKEEQFSAPVLQHIFQLLRQRWEEGLESTLDSLSARLAPEELSHLTRILQTPERQGSAEQALADYVSTIQSEYRKRTMSGDGDLLTLIRDKRSRNNT